MSEQKNYRRFLTPANIWALLWVLFQLWVVIRGSYGAMIMRPVHVCFGMGLVFLTSPMLAKNKVPKGQKYVCKWYEYLFFSAAVFCGAYMVYFSERFTTRMAYVAPLTTMDYVVSIAIILLLLECSRRAVNMALTIIVLVFIAYGFFGTSMPGILAHGGQNLRKFVECQVFTTSGIFGSPISVSVSMVFYFLLFGAFLSATPAGGLFINISNLITRKAQGGAGKATIFAAALFGMISGSAPGNVASIGTIMYKPMRNEKFDNMFTGSVLAIGGTAGQLIPPVMGAAAFIMVDMAGIKYAEIMKAAIIPSFVFLAALYFLVHLYAHKNNLYAVPIDVKQTRKNIGKHLYLLLAVVVLVYMIINGSSMMRAATYSTAVLFVLCLLRKDTRIGLYEVLSAFVTTARQAIIVAMPCALAGIIVGQITATGLGTRFTSMINMLAANSLLLALMATMLMALILGMGMPTSAAYIMSATLLCPSIIALGVPKIAAHFFVFYFANLSMITPPVALSSFTAAGIVGESMWKLGLQAFKYSFIIFLIPYAFVFNPALLGYGTIWEVLQVTVTTMLGGYAISMALIGYGLGRISPLWRIIAIASALLMVIPETTTDIVGVGLFALCMGLQLVKRKKSAQPAG